VRFDGQIRRLVYKHKNEYHLNLSGEHIQGFAKCIDPTSGFLSGERFAYVLSFFEPIVFADKTKGYPLEKIAATLNMSSFLPT
jgi:hypothetical protein